MPIVNEVEISVRKKKLMYADIMSYLELCSELDEVTKWEKDCEEEINKITENKTDELWSQTVNEQIETKKQLITLKQENRICL